jgi:hypothetical protein
MVGRLVEQQNLGLHCQRAGDRGAAALAPAGAGGVARQIDADLVGDRLHLMDRRGIVDPASAKSRRVAWPAIDGSCSSRTTFVPGTIVRSPSSESICPRAA